MGWILPFLYHADATDAAAFYDVVQGNVISCHVMPCHASMSMKMRMRMEKRMRMRICVCCTSIGNNAYRDCSGFNCTEGWDPMTGLGE